MYLLIWKAQNESSVSENFSWGGRVEDPLKIGRRCMSGPLCHLVCSLQTVCYSAEDTLYLCLKPRAASCIRSLLGLILGQVYNPSRLQLTRQRFKLNHKAGDPQTRCQPWWALQAIRRWVSRRSAVWISCIWVGREWGGLLKVLAVDETSS